MQHATELSLKEMAYQLCDCFSVNTRYITASTHIRGVFVNPTKTFNAAKHTILSQFNQGEKLRAKILTIEIDILGLADVSAAILQVTDFKSGSVNNLLSPNKNLKITESKREDVANGVYFVNTTTQSKTAVEASDIVTNNPSKLFIAIPALATGIYTLEIVTQFSNSTSLLKEPRTASSERILTVQ